MRLPGRYLSIVFLLALASPLIAQPVFRDGARHAPPEHAATIPAPLPDVAVDAMPSERPAVPESLPPVAATGTNGLSLVGFISYQVNFNTLIGVLHADRVENASTTRTSGTLRLTLWMSQGAYRQSGYRTVIYTMGQLAPNTFFSPVDSGNVTFSPPPTGCYYVSMLLEEFQSSGSYSYVDYLDFSNLISVNGGCCTYGFAASTASVAATAGSGSVNVTTNLSSCAWTATSNATWLTIGTGSGTGAGSATYSYSANSSSSPRTGTITLTGGSTYNVTQAGAAPNACSYSYSPTSNNIGAAAYNGSVTVTGTPAGCAGSWTATSNAGWLTINSGGSGSGAGPVSLSYSATANTSSQPRNGAISISGTFFNVTQAGVAAGCTQNDTTLCLANNRFKLAATWKTGAGQTGDGHAVPITSDTGYYWFFGSTNVEMVVKVIDACSFNQRFWVFAGGLTDVNVNLTITDTKTGTVKTYTNPVGVAFQPIQDTNAFATCP